MPKYTAASSNSKDVDSDITDCNSSTASSSAEPNDPTTTIIKKSSPRKRKRLEEPPPSDPESRNLSTEKWLQTFYTWTPSALSLQHRRFSESLESPIFSHDGISWRVSLYPRGYDQDSRDYFSLFIELVAPLDRAIQAKFAFYVRNFKGEYSHRVSSTHRFSSSHRVAGFSRYLKRNNMVDGFNGILCHVRVERATSNLDDGDASLGMPEGYTSSKLRSLLPAASRSSSELEKDPRRKVAADLDMLLFNDSFSDVVLVTPGREFHAHKAILAARSPVFFAMFEHDMEEKCQNRVKIDDVHDSVVQELLRFIYTGRITNVENMTCELMIAAERYALDDLKNLCERELGKRLTIDNVANFYIIADRHNAKKLKLSSIKFINEHPAEVIQTGGYRLIVDSHLHLIEELYRHEHLSS